MHPDAIAELVDPVLGALPELAWRGDRERTADALESEAAGPLDDLELLAVLRGVGEDDREWGRGVGPP
jgi:hypothetical protein